MLAGPNGAVAQVAAQTSVPALDGIETDLMATDHEIPLKTLAEALRQAN